CNQGHAVAVEGDQHRLKFMLLADSFGGGEGVLGSADFQAACQFGLSPIGLEERGAGVAAVVRDPGGVDDDCSFARSGRVNQAAKERGGADAFGIVCNKNCLKLCELLK